MEAKDYVSEELDQPFDDEGQSANPKIRYTVEVELDAWKVTEATLADAEAIMDEAVGDFIEDVYYNIEAVKTVRLYT